MKRDDRVYIQDIIDSIEIITDYVNGKSEKDFEESLEWRLMKLMRNKLIHEYFGISPNAVFATILEDLPPLLAKIKII